MLTWVLSSDRPVGFIFLIAPSYDAPSIRLWDTMHLQPPLRSQP